MLLLQLLFLSLFYRRAACAVSVGLRGVEDEGDTVRRAEEAAGTVGGQAETAAAAV